MRSRDTSDVGEAYIRWLCGGLIILIIYISVRRGRRTTYIFRGDIIELISNISKRAL